MRRAERKPLVAACAMAAIACLVTTLASVSAETVTETVQYSFCSETNCVDGAKSEGALVEGSDGNLYGTTIDGGVHGFGTVFKITPSGPLTPLYSFSGQANDGAFPAAGLVAFRGSLDKLAGGFRGPVDVLLDVDGYLREHPRTAAPRAHQVASHPFGW